MGSAVAAIRANALLTVVIVAITVACAVTIRSPGCSQSSHFGLVRALAAGTAQVDPAEVRCDSSTWRGATFSNKAPGLAFFVLPWYTLLHATQLLPEGETNAIWAVSLWGSLLPFVAMLCLLAWVATRLDLGPVAFTVGCTGLATLAFPFGTLLYSHSFSTALGFAAFAALLRARAERPRLRFVALGGLLAGFSLLTDYPLALLVLLLSGYAAWGPTSGLARRAGTFAAGAIVGVAPLFAYNAWAFGSPLHLSYTSDSAGVVEGLKSGHAIGLFGVELPSLQALAEVLVADRGLLTMTPVLAAGVAGLVLLVRSCRHRLEASLALAVTAAFLAYEASLSQGPGWPFGGASPGARFFLPAIPFAMLGIGPAFRRAPGAVAVLALISAVQMGRVFVTVPIIEDVATWAEHFHDRIFAATVLTAIAGTGGWLGALPIFVALAVAAVATALAALRTTGIDWRLTEAVAAFCAWIVVAIVGPHLAGRWQPDEAVTVIAVTAVMVTLVVAAASRSERGEEGTS